eukprot:3890273-Prymnesium_polylepis.1
MLDLIKNWCSDRAITERNAANASRSRSARPRRRRVHARVGGSSQRCVASATGACCGSAWVRAVAWAAQSRR